MEHLLSNLGIFKSGGMGRELLSAVLLLPVLNGIDAVPQWWVAPFPGAVWLMQEMGIALFASVGEEILFRGLFLPFLVKKIHWQPWLSVLLVSAAFGGLHLFNVFSYASTLYATVQAFTAFGFSCCLSAICLRYRTLRYAVAAHVLTNLAAIIPPAPAGIMLTLSPLEVLVYVAAGAIYLWQAMRIADRGKSLPQELTRR